MFSRKSNHSWFTISSAVIGGFLLGMSYKKFGNQIGQIGDRIRHMTKKQGSSDNYPETGEADF